MPIPPFDARRLLLCALLGPPLALFVTNVVLLWTISVTIAGGLGHMRIPESLLAAHDVGVVAVAIVLGLADRDRRALGPGGWALVVIASLTGFIAAARNHLWLWTIAEDLEARYLGLWR